MTAVTVSILRFVDEHQPGFVECALVDALGQSHRFVEKVPIVIDQALWSDSTYPSVGVLACQIEAEFTDAAGRLLARIDTEHPYHVESTCGTTKFVVLVSQLVR
jgi:hypothetical protein